MILFDNDVIHKLAMCDLLENAQILIQPSQEIYVLDTAKYVLKTKIQPQSDIGKTCYARIEHFLSKTHHYVPQQLDIISQLTSVKNIDSGEAMLIEAIISHHENLFFTGDKRCLIALANSQFYRTHLIELSGKAICLEQILLWLIDGLGFQEVYAKVLPARDCDKMLKAVFTASATQANVISGLNSYLNDLKRNTDKLLYHSIDQLVR
jgi:hypothetical protein